MQKSQVLGQLFYYRAHVGPELRLMDRLSQQESLTTKIIYHVPRSFAKLSQQCMFKPIFRIKRMFEDSNAVIGQRVPLIPEMTLKDTESNFLCLLIKYKYFRKNQ